MKRKKVMRSIIALTAAAVMCFTGCSNTTSSTGTSGGGADDGVFNVGISYDPPSLDPTQANDYSAELVANNLYDTLLVFDENNQLQPGLAEAWSQPDELTYVYTIRQGVHFWDGNEMTAEDVAYSMQRHMDPDTASLFAYMYDPVESIEATGPYEVTVKLKTPSTSFQYVPATMAGAVAEKSFIEEKGDTFGTPTVGTMATGPYKFESWTQGSQLTFTRNEDYWDASTQYVSDTLEFDVIEDPASLSLALTNGQLDFVNTPSMDTYEELENASNVDLCYEEGLQNGYVAFNCSKGPFSDPNVRKAAACAIDAAAIAAAQYGDGFYTDAKALDVDPEVMGYYTDEWVALNDELDSYTYDIEKAKEYLAQSSYPNGFECTMPTSTATQKSSEAIQYYLGQIGITVNLDSMPFNDLTMYVYGVNRDANGMRDYDLLSFAWFPDYADPVALLRLYYSSNEGVGGSNMFAYMNPDFDALIDASETQEGEERSQTLMDAYRMLNADCPGKMFAYFGPTYGINSKYETTMSPMWMWNFKFTKVTEK